MIVQKLSLKSSYFPGSCFYKNFSGFGPKTSHKKVKKESIPRWIKGLCLIALPFFIESQCYAESYIQKQPPYVEKKLNGYKFVDPSANVLSYPEKRSFGLGEIRQFNLGDLHGNALKLVYFLISEELASCDKQDFESLAKLYQKQPGDVTKEDLKLFCHLIENIKIHPILKGGMIRLLGDECCDRGENDYYVLKILEKLTKEKVPFEILFSNHGYELISCFEKGLMDHISYLETVECGTSLTNLRDFIKQDLISLKEVDHLIKNIYYPKLKLLSCTKEIKDQKTFYTLYSHAPIGLKTVRMLACHPYFLMSQDSIESLGLEKVIDKINRQFQSFLQNGLITEKFDHEIHNKTPPDQIPNSLPIRRCIWSRGFQANDEPIHQIGDVYFSYVHGHDGNGITEPKFSLFVINLDNLFGKGRGNERREYSSYLSHEFSEIK